MKLTASPLDENLLQLGASPELTNTAGGKAKDAYDAKNETEKGEKTHTEKLERDSKSKPYSRNPHTLGSHEQQDNAVSSSQDGKKLTIRPKGTPEARYQHYPGEKAQRKQNLILHCQNI